MSGSHDRILLSDTTRAALVAELRRSTPPPGMGSFFTMPLGYDPAPALSADDVRRIVREEMDQREAAARSPLAVSAEDVRRYLGGGR